MIFVPANRSLSLDARIWPNLRSETTPQWAPWLLAFQVGIAYFFGGVAKINYDWLIAGEPLRKWLGESTEFPLLGQLFTKDWIVYFYAWSGMLFDLLVVPALIWRKTRWLALGAVAFFHLSNSEMFQIGIFPWFMLAASGLFFKPDWFRRLVNWLTKNRWPAHPSDVGRQEKKIASGWASHPRYAGVTVSLLGIWTLLQITIPLRHFLIPGNPSWTEEAHRFSWHMKLRDKQGRARFIVNDPASGKEWVVKPKKYLSARQSRKMVTRPDMILQFSHYLADVFRAKGYPGVEVRALVLAELNGRSEQFLVNPETDLALVKRYEMPATWVMPLTAAWLKDEKSKSVPVTNEEDGLETEQMESEDDTDPNE
jgi:hypothetical protein